jgi:hypothetical protein
MPAASRLRLLLVTLGFATVHSTILNNASLTRAKLVVAMNAGGNDVSNPSGEIFVAGSTFASGARQVYENPNGELAAIVNASAWELPLFNTMEYTFKPNFDLAYTLPISGATTDVVEVELLFAELDRGIGSDERLFDVFINGELALESFDIYGTAGGRERAVRMSMFLSPAPSSVTVTFGKVARKNKPAIGALAVYNVSSLSSSTSETTTTLPVLATTTASTASKMLTTTVAPTTTVPSSTTPAATTTPLPTNPASTTGVPATSPTTVTTRCVSEQRVVHSIYL